jgi:protein involved in ribonucleotide reduction
VIAFLNDPANRALLRGVITAGNTNFGEHYCLAGPVISAKCGVPELYRFELLGTQRDAEKVNDGLTRFWEQVHEERKTA